jgi:ABC-type amino acid transport substrate-binding protein
MVRAVLLLLLMLIASCGNHQKKEIRIGVDPHWNATDLYGQEKNVNGFLEELLMEIAHETGFTFFWIHSNWNTQLDEMQQGKTNAILSVLPEYNFNLARFDFSHPILELGPVLVVPESSSGQSVQRIGILSNGMTEGALIPDVMIRLYETVPALLNAIVLGEVDGGIVHHLLASSYTNNLYAGKLKVTGSPLTKSAIRLVVPKGTEKELLRRLNKALMNKKRMKGLLDNWQLL